MDKRESHQDRPGETGCKMKNWGMVLVLALAVAAVAQDGTQSAQSTPQTAGKTISVTGKMSDDGRVLLRDADDRVWTVSNPEALQGFAGQEIVIRCQLAAESNEIHVVSVKAVKSRKEYAARWGDSAFRR